MRNEALRDLLDSNRSSDLFVASASGVKRPRQYAQEICNESNRDERNRMLKRVPNDFRPLVRKHVENYFALRKQRALRFAR